MRIGECMHGICSCHICILCCMCNQQILGSNMPACRTPVIEAVGLTHRDCHEFKVVCTGSIELIAFRLALKNIQIVLQALPFVLKTESKRQLKVDLEAKLEEICRSQNLLKQEGVLVTL